MIVSKFDELDSEDGSGVVGGGLLFGAPNAYRMSSLTLATYVHGTGLHAHLSNHSKTIIAWGLALWDPTLTKV